MTGAAPGGPIRATAERLDIEPRSFDIDAATVERRREELRRAWRYEPVDHIPVTVDLSPVCGDALRDAHLDTGAWFSSAVRHIEWSLAALPDDYIPLVRPPWLGFHTVPVMFGAQLWWADDASMPAIKTPLVTTVDQLWELRAHDPYRDGYAPQILERLRLAAACFPPEVAVGGVDMGSPLGDVLELMDQTLFFVSLKRAPEAVHHACEVVTRTQLALQEAALAAAGGGERLAAIGKWPTWRPESARCLVTDDIASLLSPTVFAAFDRPYTDRLIRPYGGGLLHICGPNHCAHLLMHDDPPTHGLNCSFRYSRGDFAALREELGPRAEERLGRRGHVEVMWERGVPLADMVRDFRELAGLFAPDVAVLPYCQVLADGSVSIEEITRFYGDMRVVAEGYARRVRWVD